jgi:BED zinc finger
MSYKCKKCNYGTNKKFCYNKHLTTKKHCETKEIKEQLIMEQKNNKYICNFCSNTFTQKSNLARHLKTRCQEKKTFETTIIQNKEILETELFNLKEKVKLLEDQNKQFADHYKHLEDETIFLRSVVNAAGTIAKNSVNTMSYIIKNFNNAPPLQPIDDYSQLQYDVKLLDSDKTIENHDNELVEIMIYYYNENTLDKYLGNFIIKLYKKDDPAQQSLWNSDTNRLTYVIRELLNDKSNWFVDKKGIKVCKCIIEPLLEHLIPIVQNYITKKSQDIALPSLDENHARRILLKLESAANILKKIQDQILANDIMKYITPFFYLNKNDD